MLGRKEGIVAAGNVDASGSLASLFELTAVDCSAATRWEVFDVPKYWSAAARGINDDGDVVGYAERRDGTASTFVRRNGVVTVFDPSELDADHSWGTGINNLGDIVGHFTVGSQWHGYLLRNGVYTQTDMPGEAAGASRARSSMKSTASAGPSSRATSPGATDDRTRPGSWDEHG